jgi:hypothetical protein
MLVMKVGEEGHIAFKPAPLTQQLDNQTTRSDTTRFELPCINYVAVPCGTHCTNASGRVPAGRLYPSTRSGVTWKLFGAVTPVYATVLDYLRPCSAAEHQSAQAYAALACSIPSCKVRCL